MIEIKLGNKKFQVEEAKTIEQKRKGLSDKTSLPKNEGMIFYWEDPQTVQMWMKDTKIPLDIIFINEDEEVIAVEKGNPNDEILLSHDDVLYVVELNQNSGVKLRDELDFEDSGPVMKVLAPDGSTQFQLWGGERIVSRRETKILIKKARKAYNSGEDKDYKALGKYMFKVLKKQDEREPEYVSSPK